MRNDYCREPSSFRLASKVRLISLTIAVAAGTLGLTGGPASADNPYCVRQGVEAATACKAEQSDPSWPLARRLSFSLNKEQRCIDKGHAVRDACQAKLRLVTEQEYKRCDQQYCWIIFATVGIDDVCLKMPKGAPPIAPGSVLPGDNPFPLDRCGDEMVAEFRAGARGDGPEILALTPIVPFACLVGDPAIDAPRWLDGYCYGIFKQGTAEVCAKAKKENVRNGAADRQFITPFTYSDCPRSVLNSRNMGERQQRHQESTRSTQGRLPPVPRGNSHNPQSDITGTNNETQPAPGTTAYHDPGGLLIPVPVPVPQNPAPQQAPRNQNNRPPQQVTPPPPSGSPPQGNANNQTSTITGTDRERETGQTPRPSERTGASPQQTQANGNDSGRPGPGGIKLDAASTGRTSDLSDVRSKILQLGPKGDSR